MLVVGNPMCFFDDVCRETYRLLMEEELIEKKKIQINEILIEEIREVIKDCKHNSEFYFQCGIAASSIASDFYENKGCDELNAAIDGYSMYLDFIGIEDDG